MIWNRSVSVVLFFFFVLDGVARAQKNNGRSVEYQCLPCGQDCDNESLRKPGKCSHCGMRLVEKSTVTFKNISPSEVCDYLRDHPSIVLLDVRTKEEFEGKTDPDYGTLKNSINVPIQALQERLPDLAGFKDKEVLVFCSHSRRSPQASYLLSQNGFKKIINMSGGMSEMKDKACVK